MATFVYRGESYAVEATWGLSKKLTAAGYDPMRLSGQLILSVGRGVMGNTTFPAIDLAEIGSICLAEAGVKATPDEVGEAAMAGDGFFRLGDAVVALITEIVAPDHGMDDLPESDGKKAEPKAGEM